MDGSRFISCAETWLSDPIAVEPILRSCVSRAYYGAFHRCGAFLRDSLAINMADGPSQHTLIPRAMGFTGNATLKRVGYQLDELRKARHLADYRIHSPTAGARTKAAIAVSDAIDIRDTLSAFSGTQEEILGMRELVAGKFPLGLPGWSLMKT